MNILNAGHLALDTKLAQIAGQIPEDKWPSSIESVFRYYKDIKLYEQHAGQTILPGSTIPSQAANTLQSGWFWKEDFSD